MATQPNLSITTTWSQAVDAALDFTISLINPVAIEWAVTDAALPPSAAIKGHRLDPLNNEGITRSRNSTALQRDASRFRRDCLARARRQLDDHVADCR